MKTPLGRREHSKCDLRPLFCLREHIKCDLKVLFVLGGRFKWDLKALFEPCGHLKRDLMPLFVPCGHIKRHLKALFKPREHIKRDFRLVFALGERMFAPRGIYGGTGEDGMPSFCGEPALRGSAATPENGFGMYGNWADCGCYAAGLVREAATDINIPPPV